MGATGESAQLGAFLLRPHTSGHELVYAIDMGTGREVDMFKAIVSTCGQTADAAAPELELEQG